MRGACLVNVEHSHSLRATVPLDGVLHAASRVAFERCAPYRRVPMRFSHKLYIYLVCMVHCQCPGILDDYGMHDQA